MPANIESNVDYSLLSRLSSLVLCSRCFRNGKVSPVPQLITGTRRPANLCPACRAEAIDNGNLKRVPRRGSVARVIRLETD